MTLWALRQKWKKTRSWASLSAPIIYFCLCLLYVIPCQISPMNASLCSAVTRAITLAHIMNTISILIRVFPDAQICVLMQVLSKWPKTIIPVCQIGRTILKTNIKFGLHRSQNLCYWIRSMKQWVILLAFLCRIWGLMSGVEHVKGVNSFM